MRHGFLAMALLALSLAPATAAPAAQRTERTAAGTQAVRRVPVTVERVRVRTVEDWRISVGQVEAWRNPLVSSEVAGKLVEVRVGEGDTVKVGEVLARIEDTDYLLARDAARADVARIRALLGASGLRVRRVRRLVRRGSAPQAQLDDATAEHDSLRAQLQAAEARLRQAERNLARTRIVSPVDGRVSRRLVSPGNLLDIGTPLFKLTAPGHVKVRLPYPERDLAVIRPGQPMEISTPSSPGGVVRTTVQRISPDIDPASRNASVLAILPNKHGWRVGASVDGRVLVARRDHALVVPEQAVVLRPEGHVVFVIGKDGRAHARRVRPGLRVNGMIEIAEGLREGETVAVDGAGFLGDGVAVEIGK